MCFKRHARGLMQATTCCPTYPNEPAARLCQNESANIWRRGGIRARQDGPAFQAARAGFASAVWAGGWLWRKWFD